MKIVRWAFIVILLIFAIRWISTSCKTDESQVIIIPGKSIAGVQLGMHRKDVVSILGEPSKEISPEDVGQHGFRILGGGKVNVSEPKMTILLYSKPDIGVVLHENDRVGSIQLGYTPNVHVEGYDFLKFKYLSRDELNRLGEPSSETRDESSEEYLLKLAPQGESIEYYVYDYEQPRLTLGLIFDKNRQIANKKYIALNYIAVVAGKELPSSR